MRGSLAVEEGFEIVHKRIKSGRLNDGPGNYAELAPMQL